MDAWDERATNDAVERYDCALVQGFLMLEHYLAHRRIWEIAGIVLMLSIGFVATLNTEFLEVKRYGLPNEFWEVAVWEATSHIALGAIIPLLLWFDHRFPIRIDTLPRSTRALGANPGTG